jgi:hypothetical protein
MWGSGKPGSRTATASSVLPMGLSTKKINTSSLLLIVMSMNNILLLLMNIIFYEGKGKSSVTVHVGRRNRIIILSESAMIRNRYKLSI